MAYNASRRSRERHLRARYRKKIWTTAIIMLIIGLILGFVVCVLATQRFDRVAELLNLSSKEEFVAPTPEPVDAADLEAMLAFEESLEYEEDFEDFKPEDFESEDFEEEIISAPTLTVVEVPDVTQEPVAIVEVPEATKEPVAIVEVPEATKEPVAIVEVPEATKEPVAIVEVPEATKEALAIVGEPLSVESLPIVEPEATQLAVIVEGEEATAPILAPTAVPAPEFTAVPTAVPTVVPTAVPTPEPTAVPTPEPVAAPEPVIVPYGQPCTFKTQIKADGSARRTADSDSYETLELTLKVDAYKDPAYFAANYAESYNLQGNEAAVEFDITLNGYTGSTEIIPQNFLLITFYDSKTGTINQGFQLMDTEIAGKTDIAIVSDTTSTLYKRYPYNADQGDMTFMAVNTYNDGVEGIYLFEILAPATEQAEEAAAPTEGEGAGEAEAAAPASSSVSDDTVLTVGTKNAEVKRLQRVLIDNGLLSGEPDGHYGNYTAAAVKEMQRRYGMEETGIADKAFLDKIYS